MVTLFFMSKRRILDSCGLLKYDSFLSFQGVFTQCYFKILIRLNFLTVILAYTMNTDYLFYYFAPLVSMWYLIIYATMVLGSRYNDRTTFLVCKILASMAIVTWFMSETWLLESLFNVLKQTCAIRWSAQEWSFRVKLDLWIVYFGMLTALIFLKIREHRLTDHALWPVFVKASIGAAALAMFWYFTFEMLQPSKFTYNKWHPFISFIPIASFFTLRNANQTLRSASSRAFAYIGRCSLETFIIQYHLWLAADTKGLLIVIPWTRWRFLNTILTTIVFIYISDQVAQATAVITSQICESNKISGTLPIHSAGQEAAGAIGRQGDRRSEAMPMVAHGSMGKDGDGSSLHAEPDTPTRPPRRWVDRLAEGPSSETSRGEKKVWNLSVVGKVAMGLVVMWLLNLLWPAP
jgi:N-acetylneuraminate 9-O-acetyltransferase